MFSSIRSRLLLTYAIAISTALLGVALIFVIYLLDNPLVYRQTRLKLAAVESGMLSHQAEWSNLPPMELQAYLVEKAPGLDARLLVISPRRVVLADSQPTPKTELEFRPLYRIFRINRSLLDASGQAWLYAVRKLDNGNLLLAAVPRPKISFLAIFTDELVPPLLWGGALGLTLALLLAYLMSRWVADPLQNLVSASQDFTGNTSVPIELGGPQEVRELADAFNHMTARVQLGQQVQREFVANVSHELKTPLTSIQGFSQALLDGTASTQEEKKQAAQVIFDEAGRMRRLVLDLLDLARLDAGITVMAHAPVDIAALLTGLVERFLPAARQAGVALEIQVTGQLLIRGDGERLAQVFSNLIDNALKYTPSGGRAQISAIASEGFVEIKVSDSGQGISSEALPRIFDRFYQADVSRQGGARHGAGLGLAIAREIVHAHAGTISVTSTPGQGSEFSVRIPQDNTPSQV